MTVKVVIRVIRLLQGIYCKSCQEYYIVVPIKEGGGAGQGRSVAVTVKDVQLTQRYIYICI